jgi:predicted outer membrane repeat protein
MISNTTFTDCNALKQGGAIYASAFTFIEITTSTFTNNRAQLQQGDNLYLTNTENSTIINNTNFISPNA